MSSNYRRRHYDHQLNRGKEPRRDPSDTDYNITGHRSFPPPPPRDSPHRQRREAFNSLACSSGFVHHSNMAPPQSSPPKASVIQDHRQRRPIELGGANGTTRYSPSPHDALARRRDGHSTGGDHITRPGTLAASYVPQPSLCHVRSSKTSTGGSSSSTPGMSSPLPLSSRATVPALGVDSSSVGGRWTGADPSFVAGCSRPGPPESSGEWRSMPPPNPPRPPRMISRTEQDITASSLSNGSSDSSRAWRSLPPPPPRDRTPPRKMTGAHPITKTDRPRSGRPMLPPPPRLATRPAVSLPCSTLKGSRRSGASRLATCKTPAATTGRKRGSNGDVVGDTNSRCQISAANADAVALEQPTAQRRRKNDGHSCPGKREIVLRGDRGDWAPSSSHDTTTDGAFSGGKIDSDDEGTTPGAVDPSSSHDTKTDGAFSRGEIDLTGSDDEGTSPGAVDPCGQETHLIFAIDYSGSMNKNDVKKSNGQKCSRWNAVFDCLDVFISEQLKNNGVESGDDFIVSLLLFNDRAQTLFQRMPLVEDGLAVRQALESARVGHKPHQGTQFTAGFARAKSIATGNSNRKKQGGNVILLFLSDGRPGDLSPFPPNKKNHMSSKAIEKQRKKLEDIEQMKNCFGVRFSLQLVCIHEEGKPWMEYLANRYNGTFHMPERTLDFSAPIQTKAPTGPSVRDSDTESQEIIEVGTKTAEALVQERFRQAEVAGRVHAIGETATTASSMRSTFQTISTTVTAMRNGGSRRPRERQGIVLESVTARGSQMVKYEATRMVLDDASGKIVIAPGERPNCRLVKMAIQPFAQGGIRFVYRMKEIAADGTKDLVAKEPRHEVPYAERLRFHRETSTCQARASEYASWFNSKVQECHELKDAIRCIKVLQAEVYRWKTPTGAYKYVAVEAELKGRYEKWNNNNGFVLQVEEGEGEARKMECQVAQTFSHFSFEHSDGKEMVVDIQGSDYVYTDPQLHSKRKLFGRADRGENGFSDFFKTHQCNGLCKALGLKGRQREAKET